MKSEGNYKELVGIIGGVGPEATNYFTSLLLKLRLPYANKDQDHIPYLLFNNPQIPDRTKYLLFGSESPIEELIRTGDSLKKAGATFLVIPCNAAHSFTKEIEESVGLPVMNMIDLTVQYIRDTYGKDVTVGLLATDGTIKSKIYQKTFNRITPEISIVLPDEKSQANVMKAIYEVKAFSTNENNFQLLFQSASKLKQKGASVIILGCTEIPLALTPEKCDFNRVDPMEILARKVIERIVTDAPVEPTDAYYINANMH